MLRKDTELRAHLTYEVATTAVGPELASAGSVRRVTLITPEAPTVYVALDRDVTVDVPTYSMVPIATGIPVVFHLRPEQTLCARVETGSARLSIVIEYLTGGV